jgi:hypothetical protein
MSTEYDFTVEVYLGNDSKLISDIVQLVQNKIFTLHNLYNLNSILKIDSQYSIIVISLKYNFICSNIVLKKHKEKRSVTDIILATNPSIIIRTSDELARFMTLYSLGFKSLHDFIHIEETL